MKRNGMKNAALRRKSASTDLRVTRAIMAAHDKLMKEGKIK